MDPTIKILSIMPAAPDTARVLTFDDGSVYEEPILGWALTSEGFIEPLTMDQGTGGLSIPAEQEEVCGIRYPNMPESDAEELKEQINRRKFRALAMPKGKTRS